MSIINNSINIISKLDYITIVICMLSLFLLGIVALTGIVAPLFLFFLLIAFGSVLITVFSNKDEILLKIKLFVFFFSGISVYTLANHYVLVNFFPETQPFMYVDGPGFFRFANLGMSYISGERNFFDIFSVYTFHEFPLHIVFSATIAYFSNLIDGSNTIIIQKMLSPFFGGIFSVVLYSTLKYQFKDTLFVLKATFAYSLLSAVFVYSTSLMRDIDIALAYMIFFYIFFQTSSYKNFFLLLLVALITTYLRTESGLVLYGTSLIYVYLYVRKIQSTNIKLVLYILVAVLFSIVVSAMYIEIGRKIVNLNEANIQSTAAKASADSIGLLLNKLPFPMNYVTKVLFGQIQPFPFLNAIDRPPEAISGIFWPFVLIIMFYALIKKNIRSLIDIKIKYLLIVAIAILFLMSAEPMARRMMSVYPIIYITSLYVFLIVPNNEIKRIFSLYLFGIISLNVFYYILKL